jgi:hypothetical protein
MKSNAIINISGRKECAFLTPSKMHTLLENMQHMEIVFNNDAQVYTFYDADDRHHRQCLMRSTWMGKVWQVTWAAERLDLNFDDERA